MVEPLPTEEAKANTTDPDSRIMKTRQGYVQGYNAQAVVSEDQIIVAVGVTQEANDVQQLEPMLQTMAHTLEAAGIEDRPKAGLADAGYWSEANIRACSWPEMPELLIATTKDWKQRKMLREKGCPRGRIPKGLSPRDRMERKLLTKRGRALYKKRSVLYCTVLYWWSRCSDRSRKDRDSDGLCDGGWALHRVSGRWQGLPITCSSYGAVAKRLGAGPRHHGTKRVDDLSGADKRPVQPDGPTCS